METIRELYTAREIGLLQQKKKRTLAAVILLAAAALAVCVCLCRITNVLNAQRMELTAIAVSTVAGWVDICLISCAVNAAKWEAGHALMLQSGQRETVSGVLSVEKQRLRIRNSIPFRMLLLEQQDGERRRIKVIETRVKMLKGYEGKRVRIYTVNGYAAAVEEL